MNMILRIKFPLTRDDRSERFSAQLEFFSGPEMIAKQCESGGEYYQSNIQVKPCVDDNENQGGGNFQKTKTLVVDVGEKN